MTVNIDDLLKKAVQMGASDLHIKVGSPPIVRINGQLSTLSGEKRLSAEDTNGIVVHVMNDTQKEKFKKKNDIDLSYSIPGFGRFRCNAFIQRGTTGVVFRIIPMKILEIEQLHLPPVLKKIALEPRGLILVTGTTGSGKTTTLASLIEYINFNRTNNIITIEDPIEFLHRDKSSIISQREIGSDTESFSKSLRAALRQDPDVILVGEMRDFETIQTSLIAAETGHLVLSTLHTVDSTETVNRIISVFPPYQHKQVRIQLASVLRAIASMRLVPRADGNGRVPAVEVLIGTTTIKDCIEDPDKTKSIPDFISKGYSQYGMQTFDQSLFDLYKKGFITYEDALHRTSSPDDFVLKVKGIQSTSDSWDDQGKKLSEKKDGPKIERFSR
ncbi:MAG: PilT/PilU family type 4a pilus ATPase [Thermodesulfovibrionia bacterium]|nr:PilT/PilU family type 4a pilus ATPase [Thermodesulfovibrionia bacterium]